MEFCGVDDSLEQMYQEVILQAARDLHGKKHFEGADETGAAETADLLSADLLNADPSNESNKALQAFLASASSHATHEYCSAGQSRQFNPTCGDVATVYVALSESEEKCDQNGGDENMRLESVAWDGQGCSISQASLSIMYDLVNGQKISDVMNTYSLFRKLMESRGEGLDDEADEDVLDEAVVFQGVSRYPMRIKCALLGWESMKAAIGQALASHQTSQQTSASRDSKDSEKTENKNSGEKV